MVLAGQLSPGGQRDKRKIRAKRGKSPSISTTKVSLQLLLLLLLLASWLAVSS